MRQQILNLFTTPRDMSWEDILLNIVLAAVLGFFIFLSYAISHRGTIYSRKFNASLVILTVLTGTVMTVIGNNIALSLGMVGALSIVRFRTAIKEPLDIAFLFWAIAAGIVLAAGMIPLAVIGSVVIGVMLLVFVNRKPHQNPYLAVITCEDDHAEQMARDFLAATVEKSVVKSKTVTRDQIELNYEIRLKGSDTSFVNGLTGISGVTSAVLVSYNGEYMG